MEKSLPPKTETVIFAGMSTVQKELYKKILMRDIHLINQGLTAREQAGKGGEGAVLLFSISSCSCASV